MNKYIIIILLTLSFLLFSLKEENNLKVSFLDIGQGDSILVSVNDLNILIDGGPNNLLLHELGEGLPWHERKIDYLVISHYHADHFVGFIELINKYEIGEVLVTDHRPDDFLYHVFMNKLKEYNYTVTVVNQGDRFQISEGVYFDIILAD